MSTTANKALVASLFEELNRGNMAALEPHPGFWETRQYIPMAQRSFSEWETVMLQQIAEGDKVFSYGAVQLTHNGPFAGIAPTGRRATIIVFSLEQVVDGIVQEHNSTSSWPSVMREIGAPAFQPWPVLSPRPLTRPQIVSSATPQRLAINKAAVASLLLSLIRGRKGATPAHEGLSELHNEIAAIRSAFEGLEYQLIDQSAENDLVATRGTLHGYHQREIFGLPPSNNLISWDYFGLSRVVDGVVVEHRGSADWNAALTQM